MLAIRHFPQQAAPAPVRTAMGGGGDMSQGELARRPMQLSRDAGLHLGPLLSFRDLQSACTARLALATLPELIAGLPRGRLDVQNGRGHLPLHCAARHQASAEAVAALLGAHPEAAPAGD